MKLLFCINKDLHAYTFLRELAQQFPIQGSSVFYTQGVGSSMQRNTYLEYLQVLESGIPESVAAASPQPRYFRRLVEQYGLNLQDVTTMNAGELAEAMAQEAPDVVMSVRFGKIFKKEAIAIPSQGILNLHSGLLPEYRGILATFWSLLEQRPHYGYTLHWIDDERIDTGKILKRRVFSTVGVSSVLDAVAALYPDGAAEVANLLQRLARGETLLSTPQEGPGRYFSKPAPSECRALVEEIGMPLVDLSTYWARCIANL